MHKYFLRLFIEEEKKVPSQPAGGERGERGEKGEKGERTGDRERERERGGGGGGAAATGVKPHPTQHQMIARPILSVEFPETTFIAVTAYQNEEVRLIKLRYDHKLSFL